jgi:energy-coupling factor transport system ATP-binding protein
MILIQTLSFSYAPNWPPVLLDLNLEIRPHSWVTISGPDGSGKSTLGKLIKGLLRSDSGSIIFDPRFLKGHEEVGYLGGDPYDALVGVTVEDDVAFGLENLGMEPGLIGQRLEEALKRTGLDQYRARLVDTLSGGEQQRVALAGILASGMKVLILDECLAMLDRPVRKSIRSLLRSLQINPGLTILQISNDWEDILAADRVLYLSFGRLMLDVPPLAFLSSGTGKVWGELSGGTAALRRRLLDRGVSHCVVDRLMVDLDS